MPLELENPIVVPEKVLDKVWLANFHGVSVLNSFATLDISLVPYNAEGETGPIIKLDQVSVFDMITPGSELFDAEAAKLYQGILALAMKLAKVQGKI